MKESCKGDALEDRLESWSIIFNNMNCNLKPQSQTAIKKTAEVNRNNRSQYQTELKNRKSKLVIAKFVCKNRVAIFQSLITADNNKLIIRRVFVRGRIVRLNYIIYRAISPLIESKGFE